MSWTFGYLNKCAVFRKIGRNGFRCIAFSTHYYITLPIVHHKLQHLKHLEEIIHFKRSVTLLRGTYFIPIRAKIHPLRTCPMYV